MRFLITITALLASAAAAPSGAFVGPLAAPIVPLAAPIEPLAAPIASLVAIPAPIPTLSPGDLQAAAINAKVQAEDQARAFADQAREQAEQALENQKVKVEETVDEAKEKSDDGFWAGEDKKWQALDAVNIAQAKLQGSVANIEGAVANFEGSVAANAEVLAKSALSGAVIIPAAPFVAPFSPILYAAPGYVAPLTKTLPTDAVNQISNPEPPNLEEKESVEVKAAEQQQLPKESELPAKLTKEQVIAFPGALSLIGGGKIEPWIAPIAYINPGIPAFAATPLAHAPFIPGQVLAPAFLKY